MISESCKEQIQTTVFPVASYHSCDFDFMKHQEDSKSYSFPPVTSPSDRAIVEEPNIQWELFYGQHQSGNVYKPRRYIVPEFHSWLSQINSKGGVIVEAGCGHGCTVLPLFDAFPNTYFFLTDYSVNALKLFLNNNNCLKDKLWASISQSSTNQDMETNITLHPIDINKSNEVSQPSIGKEKVALLGELTPVAGDPLNLSLVDSIKAKKNSSNRNKGKISGKCGSCIIKDVHVERIQGCSVWDITVPFPGADISSSSRSICSAETSSTLLFDGLLCVFVLSAVLPELHIDALKNMRACLKPGGVVMFRDYAVYDMTMFRHRIRLSDKLFQRHHIHHLHYHVDQQRKSNNDNHKQQQVEDQGEDGTLVYYFDVEYLRTVAEAAGLEVTELEYATVINKNRKVSNVATATTTAATAAATAAATDAAGVNTNTDAGGNSSSSAASMKRVFLHAVLRRPQ